MDSICLAPQCTADLRLFLARRREKKEKRRISCLLLFAYIEVAPEETTSQGFASPPSDLLYIREREGIERAGKLELEAVQVAGNRGRRAIRNPEDVGHDKAQGGNHPICAGFLC